MNDTMMHTEEYDFFIKKLYRSLNTFSCLLPNSNWVHHKEEPRNVEYFIYVLDGEAMLCPGDRQFHVRANDIIHIPSHLPYESHGIKHPFYYFELSFEADMQNTELDVVIHDKNNYFMKKFEAINNKWISKNYGYILEIKSMIYSLVAELMTEKELNQSPNRYYEIITKSNAYIEENLTNPYFSVDELVSSSGVSNTYFRKIFQKFHGTSPLKHINYLRILRAQEYLKNTDMSISQIATTIGFVNIYYFSNVFKATTGVSPLNYRKTHKK